MLWQTYRLSEPAEYEYAATLRARNAQALLQDSRSAEQVVSIMHDFLIRAVGNDSKSFEKEAIEQLRCG